MRLIPTMIISAIVGVILYFIARALGVPWEASVVLGFLTGVVLGYAARGSEL